MVAPVFLNSPGHQGFVEMVYQFGPSDKPRPQTALSLRLIWSSIPANPPRSGECRDAAKHDGTEQGDRIMLKLAFALTGLAVAATCFAVPTRAADTYELPAVMPLTGGAAFLGTGEQKALQLIEKSTNATGGIKGRMLKFVFHDDESNPQLGVQLASDVIAKKPAVMIGSSLVAVCRAMAPLMKDGPVEYCLSPGIHPTEGYVFTASTSTIDLINDLIRYFRMKGWKNVALMVSSDATGQDAENGVKSVMELPENKDMQLVKIAHFNTTDVSVVAQVEDVKAAHPQAFIAWSTGTPIATIFRAIIQAGLDIPIATTGGNMTYQQMTQYADFLPKQLYIPSSQWVVRDPKLLAPELVKPHQRFYEIYQQVGMKPDEASELAWDAGEIVVDALRKLGPDATALQMHDYIANLTDYPGIDGLFNFKKVPQRGLDVSSGVVSTWDTKLQTWVPVSKPGGVPLF
jgi:branched-chain amino acid transport system substrate-binding protein